MAKGRSIKVSLIAGVVLAALSPLGSGAPTGVLVWAPVIEHEPVPSLPANGFPRLQARIESEAPIGSAKLFFRAAGSPTFHYVKMTPTGTAGIYQAILPIPSAETTAVEYFFAAITDSYESGWSGTFRAPTSSNSPHRAQSGPSDSTPEIWVGKAEPSAPDLPPGFESRGVAGFIG